MLSMGGQLKHKVIVVLGTACVLLAILLVRQTWFAHAGGPAASAPGEGRLPADPPVVAQHGELSAAVAAGEEAQPGAAGPSGTRDRVLESAVLERSLSEALGLWDSHPDADVARVLLPGLVGREQLAYPGIPIDSNRYGQRERPYELPKPPGLVRIVLLGDSFIFGQGVRADERLGARLEDALRTRAGVARPVEVLHLGAASWNLVAECSFLRRQLSLLQPDLVLHVSVPNDLDDTVGVRGSGLEARLVPRRPAQGDSVVRQLFAHWALVAGAFGHLPRGVDDESRSRLAEAAAHIARLAAAVEAGGGRYVHVFHWRNLNPVAHRYLAGALRDEQTAWLPISFYRDERFRLAPDDDHWSVAGHEVMARFLYGLLQSRALLASLAPQPWPEATRAFLDFDQGARRIAQDPAHLAEQQDVPVAAVFDLADLDAATAAQVHAGIDADGLVGPYASLMLATAGGRTLRLVGRPLGRPELAGGRLRVLADECELGSLPLGDDAVLEWSFPLPPAVAGRRVISVRLLSDDFVYSGPQLRDCVSLRLARVAIED